jgi:hypothetical protein
MSNATSGWDRLARGVRHRLPEWARYRGKATWSLSAFVYGALLLLTAVWSFLSGWLAGAAAIGVGAWAALLLGNYFRKAAKKRVRCSNCDRKARGLDRCPHCGQLTYEVKQ